MNRSGVPRLTRGTAKKKPSRNCSGLFLLGLTLGEISDHAALETASILNYTEIWFPSIGNLFIPPLRTMF